MEIGEFSKKTGIPIDTLRFYNKINLLEPKRINKRRRYDEKDMEKAQVIIKLKLLNFKLEEIRALFELEKGIEENEVLSIENKLKITNCLTIIEEKYNEILRQEKDLIQIKLALKKMVHKTNSFLGLESKI